jgi:outer membrane protein TolC
MRTLPRAFGLGFSLGLTLLAAQAGAQMRPTPPAPTATPGAAMAVDIPAPPTVNDPMLAPVPRAAVEVATWERALEHVRVRSTDLRIAAEEIERAEAQGRTALAGALTTINGQATYTHNLITNPTLQFARGDNGQLSTQPVRTPFPNFVTGGLSLTQPLFAPRAWYAIGTADRAADAARLTFDDTKRQIALNVANAIVAVVTAERIAELNRTGLTNALTRLELTTRRNALGGATGLDVVRARQDVETTRATLIAGDESLRQAREALGLALGIPGQVGVPPQVDLNGLEAHALASCKAASKVEDRPDVAALRSRIEIAARAHKDVKYQFSPTVNLQSQVATTTIDTGAAPSTTWNVQGVLTVPIWDGGARYAALRDTEAQELQAIQRFESARRQAVVQVEQARRGVSVGEDRRKVAAQARELAFETDRLTRAAYIEGRGTSLELVAAAQALREAEINLALRDFELVRARVLAVLALASCPW